MAGQSISVDAADQMVTTYVDYMTNLGVNMEEQTQSVSFTLSDLRTWLDSVANRTDEIRVFMAAYPSGEPNEGRTTVILWPYRNGAPAVDGNNNELDPYNEGTGQP